jgi:peptidyl-prolyl cis-trans isomerase B (cyclophilin B)
MNETHKEKHAMPKYLMLFILTLFVYSCKDNKMIAENSMLKEQLNEVKSNLATYQQTAKSLDFLINQMNDIKARINTNYGNIEVEFLPDKAPLHCFNFISRAESGYYNNTQFHRVIKGFMIQGGDPNTKTDRKDTYGQGGPIANIPHEFNDVKHTPGILSMARPGNVAVGAGSQFFIMHAAYPSLDGQYTVFGKVTAGMDVVDKIANVPTIEAGRLDRPEKPVIIRSIEVYR